MVIYRISIRKYIPILIAEFGLVLLCVVSILYQGYSLLATVMLAVFLSLFVLSCISYVKNTKEPILLFDIHGIAGFSIGRQQIPWSKVQALSFHSQGALLFKQKYISISTIDKGQIKVYLSYLNHDAERIFQQACQFCDASKQES